MSMSQNSPRDRWLLHKCRTAVFFLTECWEALWAIERILECKGDSPDAIGTFFDLHPLFSRRDLSAPDLALFLNVLRECSTVVVEQSLSKSTTAELLKQLRKANWTYDQVLRLSNAVARRIKLDPEIVLQQFNELAIPVDGPVTMNDVDEFLLATPPTKSVTVGQCDTTSVRSVTVHDPSQ